MSLVLYCGSHLLFLIGIYPQDANFKNKGQPVLVGPIREQTSFGILAVFVLSVCDFHESVESSVIDYQPDQ